MMAAELLAKATMVPKPLAVPSQHRQKIGITQGRGPQVPAPGRWTACHGNDQGSSDAHIEAHVEQREHLASRAEPPRSSDASRSGSALPRIAIHAMSTSANASSGGVEVFAE